MWQNLKIYHLKLVAANLIPGNITFCDNPREISRNKYIMTFQVVILLSMTCVQVKKEGIIHSSKTSKNVKGPVNLPLVRLTSYELGKICNRLPVVASVTEQIMRTNIF